jgi:carboxyl-terminal processing protease
METKIIEHQNDKKEAKTLRKVLIIFFIIFLIIGSFNFGYSLGSVNNSNTGKNSINLDKVWEGGILNKNISVPENISKDVDFSIFWEVWKNLEDLYVDKDKINEKKMFYGALKGLASSLGDPYTVFMDPQISKEFSDDLAGTFEGIGAEIGIKKEVITIVAPLPDMPAEKAGLKAGDKIIAIDGQSTSGMGVDEAVNKIRGKKGTVVVLSIYRDGFDDIKKFSITRDVVLVKSVRTEKMADGIFKIQVTNFNNDTQQGFDEAVSAAVTENPKGLILDLRNNPGGYLETAIEMASEWVEDGVVVKEKYADGKIEDHEARGRARLKNIPTAVLVNEGSASASEIVSGALQDDEKAVLVGKKTFGKGSVQTLLNLKDGSSMKVTIAKWLTPKGRSISDEGIMPDIIVDLTPDDYNSSKDPQMEKAKEILKKGDLQKVIKEAKEAAIKASSTKATTTKATSTEMKK